MSFSVCSFNFGSGTSVYKRLSQPQTVGGLTDEQYMATEMATSRKLLQSGAKVFCLQEIFHDKVRGEDLANYIDRDIVQQLRTQKFEIIRADTTKGESARYPLSDTVVAISTEEFKDIKSLSTSFVVEDENKSYIGRDLAIAIATNKESKAKYLFVSGHSAASSSEKYLEKVSEIVSKIMRKKLPDHVIMGLDLEKNPFVNGHRKLIENLFSGYEFKRVGDGEKGKYFAVRAGVEKKIEVDLEEHTDIVKDVASCSSDWMPLFLSVKR